MVLTKWTAALNTKFISLYYEQECLWKVEDPLYRDKGSRDAALSVICERMNLKNLNLDDVKRKIKYLRSTYMIEINKIEKHLQSGKIYKPCLSWFNQMDLFIRSQLRKSGYRAFLINDPNASDTSTGDLREDSESKHSIEACKIMPNKHSDTERSRQLTGNDATFQLEDVNRDPLGLLNEIDAELTSSSSKRTRVDLEVSPVIQDTKSMSKSHYREDENECDVFGKYVAIQLRTLDEEDGVMAQEEIQSILTRYRLKKIRQKYDSCETKSDMF